MNDHIEAPILLLYAADHAQRRVDADSGAVGSGMDEDQAAERVKY